MTIKCSVYIATSVDGFIAKTDSGIEWLEIPEHSNAPMLGLSCNEIMATADGLVMGCPGADQINLLK